MYIFDLIIILMHLLQKMRICTNYEALYDLDLYRVLESNVCAV